MSSPDPEMQKEIDAMIYAEIQRRDRRNARFWFAALLAGIVASIAAALIGSQPGIRALLALIGFVGIFGFLAFLSARKSLRG
jgi:fatty acid desaturase